MNTIEIRDEEIDVEEIMCKIRENIKKRRESSAYTDTEEMKDLIEEPLQTAETGELDTDNLQQELDYLNRNWDTHAEYSISSHRRFTGWFLIKGRQLVHGEVRRYVDLIVGKQNEFNAYTVRVVNNLIQGIEDKLKRTRTEISTEIEDKVGQARAEIGGEIEDKVGQARTEIGGEIDNRVGQVKTELSGEIEERIKNLEEREKEKLTAPWVKFYDKEITEEDLSGNVDHHEYFISLVKEYALKAAEGRIPKLLEVGLGTATMSIYLSRYSYEVVGIDNDPAMIYKAIDTNKKLGGYAKFILMDAFDLDMLKDNYFDVALSQGTLEHFDNEEVVKLISKQLKVAKYVIFSVPSVDYPDRELGNERKMTVEDWGLILKDAGFNILKMTYYQNNWHIVCVIGGE
jgi:O-antigen chain-terminating methyltransferase